MFDINQYFNINHVSNVYVTSVAHCDEPIENFFTLLCSSLSSEEHCSIFQLIRFTFQGHIFAVRFTFSALMCIILAAKLFK